MNIQLILLLALVLSVMAGHSCLACGTKFKDNGGLSKHRRHCKSMAMSLKNTGNEGLRRLEEQAKRTEASVAAPAEVDMDNQVRVS